MDHFQERNFSVFFLLTQPPEVDFGPSKVVTFDENLTFFLVYLLNGAK